MKRVTLTEAIKKWRKERGRWVRIEYVSTCIKGHTNTTCSQSENEDWWGAHQHG